MPKAQALDGDDLVPVTKAARGAEPTPIHAARSAVPSAALVAMQFRMPAEFVEAFKVRAAQRHMKLNDLLHALFAESSDMSVKPRRERVAR